jgi:hypothetical protein
MNNESLQALVRSFMKKDTLDADKLDKVFQSMSGLWSDSQLHSVRFPR